MGLRPDKGVQMVAVDDSGAFAALAFGEPETFLGQTIELAGDQLTETQIAETLTKVIGRPVRLTAPQMPEGASPAPDQMAMGYDADIAALRKFYPPLETFEQWLLATGWENAEPMPIPTNPSRWG